MMHRLQVEANYVLHIVFSPSAAGMIRHVLNTSGRPEPVIALNDNLANGPVASVSIEERLQWLLQNAPLGASESASQTDMDDVRHVWLREDEGFWLEAVKPNKERTVWLSRRCAGELIGFCKFISLLDDDCQLRIIDFTNEKFVNVNRDGNDDYLIVAGLGLLNEDQMRRGFEIERTATAAEFAAERVLWRKLCTENAELRIYSDKGELLSGGIDVFDSLILSQIINSWQKTALIIARSLAAVWKRDGYGYHTVGDDFLLGRVLALHRDNKFEARGDLRLIRQSEIRRNPD